MAARGIKTKIAFNVAILVLLSALIADVLVVVVVQSMLVQREVEQSRHILEEIGRQVAEDLKGKDKDRPMVTPWPLTQPLAANLKTLLVADHSGRVRFQREDPLYSIASLKKVAETTQQNHQAIVKKMGVTWSVFWWSPKAAIISVPIKADDRIIGVATGINDLKIIYQRISKFNNPILLYIVINTIILTFIGLYRIFKLYLRPIDRIVRQADDYHEDDDLFFTFRQEDNQLNRLSSSLNRMLNRIKADKKTLQKTVASLEKANTALKDAQKKIIQAEKMASVGRLASGIAHEIGNPIGIVLGYLDLLKKSDMNKGEENEFLMRAEDEVQRINTVIRQLLDLARPKDPDAQAIELNGVIEDIVTVMRMQPIMSNVQVDAELGDGESFVWGNTDQLRQVFLNLLLNAGDAIQSGANSNSGRITIQTVRLDKPDNDHPCLVQIRFKDNGIGMAPETLDNIFDPFYTTKEPGKGTGLGLAVSFMIIEGMGGSLSAESKMEQGSTFIVELPLAKQESS